MPACLFGQKKSFRVKLAFKKNPHINIVINTCLKIEEQDQEVIARGSNQSSLVKTLLLVGNIFAWQCQAELNKLFSGIGVFTLFNIFCHEHKRTSKDFKPVYKIQWSVYPNLF